MSAKPYSPKCRRDNYAFLQQHICLTGLRSEAFKDAMDSIMEAQLIFERCFADGTLVKWYPDNTDDCLAMDISNRYLETKNAHPQEQSQFEKGVNPKGILAAACNK